MFLKAQVVRSNNRHKTLEAMHLKRGDMLKFNYHSTVRHAQELSNRVLTLAERKKKFKSVKSTDYNSIPF